MTVIPLMRAQAAKPVTVVTTDVADAHRSVSLVVDGSKRLHVAWGQHNDALNYARAVAPGAIELESKRPMT